ncbi:hypothetical protein AB0B45_36160 [Nonomuraea sp. NPDC049152]|uniref:trypsin-like serine peptidase n=1 Tax=Nonomuraea sp. NPDC049152 TaxID=3154350 RepID=UPI0033F9AB62
MRPLTIACLTLVAATLTAGVASADPEGEGPVGHQVPSSFAATEDYWTPERMAAAEPIEEPAPESRPTPRQAAAQGEQVDIAPTPGPSDRRWIAPLPNNVTQQKTWNRGGAIARTAGKVFGIGGNGRDFVASGNVVTSKDGDVVVTVAHALINDDKQWSKNLVFVPAYKDGKAPYGKFAARTMFIWSGYTDVQGNDSTLDFGMLVVKPVGGKQIQKVVGGQGIRFNATPNGARNVLLGYPSNGNAGKTLQYCTGPSVNPAYGMTYAIICDMGGGSSGGPWFQSFNSLTGSGYQISAHALRNSTTSYGAFFGDQALKTFRAAEAA